MTLLELLPSGNATAAGSRVGIFGRKAGAARRRPIVTLAVASTTKGT